MSIANMESGKRNVNLLSNYERLKFRVRGREDSF